MRTALCLLALLCPLCAQPRDLKVEPVRVTRRLALVIGNAAYRGEPLVNPVNDATSMAAALRRIGMETTVAQNKDSGNRRVFEAFVKRFPGGPLAELALEKLQALPVQTSGGPVLPQAKSETQVDGAAQQARLLRQPKPVYPPLAKQMRIQGRVRFYTVIAEDGKVAYLEVVDGHPLLITAAMDAVKQWEYQPFYVNGVAGRVLTFIDVNFTLQ